MYADVCTTLASKKRDVKQLVAYESLVDRIVHLSESEKHSTPYLERQYGVRPGKLQRPITLDVFTMRPCSRLTSSRNVMLTSIIPNKFTSNASLWWCFLKSCSGPKCFITPALFSKPQSPARKLASQSFQGKYMIVMKLFTFSGRK